MNDHDEAHLFDEGDMTEDDFRQYLPLLDVTVKVKPTTAKEKP